jgi:hypothetical protein
VEAAADWRQQQIRGSSRLEATEVEAADWRQQRWRQQTGGSRGGGSSRLEAAEVEAAADWEMGVKEEAEQRWEGDRLAVADVGAAADWRRQRWRQQTGGSRGGGGWRQQRWRQKTGGNSILEAAVGWRQQWRQQQT